MSVPIVGFVYKYTDKFNKIYIGSTTQGLQQRDKYHRTKKDTTFALLDDECVMELLEIIVNPVNLRESEQDWIDKTENCVNQRRAFTTYEMKLDQAKQASKKFAQEHPDILKQRKKDYYERRGKTLNLEIVKCPHCETNLQKRCLRKHIVKQHP